MPNDQAVLYVADLAQMLGRTEAAIRAAVNRDDKTTIPPRLDMGRRICWRRATVEAWLQAREQGAKKPAGPAMKGRKAKAGA